ncbi:RNA-directed DNA polymerase [Geitlerinema sp. P-1104]|uniref:RNA-directed DNA polymerase n=1 Tax=Geitlerinema sp. P-1104 TaxID=2546230 RepID=UPI0014768745|nr:RNA-directed DNA polymerase [Geitlerinema sp. P-1104]NMG59269.1 RNA-directed DNA polymerase [Geitlerinema sp. P-1104]
MDHIQLLNQVRRLDNINLSYDYALNDRKKNDSYFNHIEIDYFSDLSCRNKVIQEIQKELQDPDIFHLRPTFAYYIPKNNLCYRRMIYIPFKDLVVRYAFVTVIADILDVTLSDRCFANRREVTHRCENFLLENYHEKSLPNFRNWQKQCVENSEYHVLIRTDISSFYDSVSHQYLIQTLAEQLSINTSTDFMQLFAKLLRPQVISYSQKTTKPQAPQVLKHGLTIGNNLEGFLANLYLRDVDEVMENDRYFEQKSIEFGRYNDDMRIFAGNRKTAKKYLLILQEYLLSKGLNLNSSKTLIAENSKDIEEIRTKFFGDLSPDTYDPKFESQDTEDKKFASENIDLENHIDKEDYDSLKDFDANAPIETDRDAKNFCKFLQHYMKYEERNPSHVQKLEVILTQFQGSSRHASWLLVQSYYYKNIKKDTQLAALNSIFIILESDESLSYTKSRIIHHLSSVRIDRKSETKYRLIERLNTDSPERINKILITSLKVPAYELNLTAIYALYVLGKPMHEIESYIRQYMRKPLSSPILEAISYLRKMKGLNM